MKYKYSNNFNNFSYKNVVWPLQYNNTKMRKKFPIQLYLANLFQEILLNHFREAELSKSCSQIKLLKIVFVMFTQ